MSISRGHAYNVICTPFLVVPVALVFIMPLEHRILLNPQCMGVNKTESKYKVSV